MWENKVGGSLAIGVSNGEWNSFIWCLLKVLTGAGNFATSSKVVIGEENFTTFSKVVIGEGNFQ